jgi:hypothetical protein
LILTVGCNGLKRAIMQGEKRKAMVPTSATQLRRLKEKAMMTKRKSLIEIKKPLYRNDTKAFTGWKNYFPNFNFLPG